MKRFFITITTVVFFTSLSSIVFAADKVIRCNIFTIEASNSGAGLDSGLKEYAEIFKNKPFDKFNSFKLVSTKKINLSLGEKKELSLHTDLKGSLKFTGLSGKQLKLSLKLIKSNGSPVIIEGKALPGTPFIAAGLKSGHGRWVIAVECTD